MWHNATSAMAGPVRWAFYSEPGVPATGLYRNGLPFYQSLDYQKNTLCQLNFELFYRKKTKTFCWSDMCFVYLISMPRVAAVICHFRSITFINGFYRFYKRIWLYSFTKFLYYLWNLTKKSNDLYHSCTIC